MWQLTLIFIAFALFVTYNTILVINNGIPKSLSESFYIYDSKKKGLGYVFSAFLLTTVGLMLPSWLDVGEFINPNFTFLIFLTLASLLFVGATPAFKDNPMVGNIHDYAAKFGVMTALIWCFVVCMDIWWIPLVAALIPTITCILTKTWKGNVVFWLEMIAFSAIFASVIISSVIVID